MTESNPGPKPEQLVTVVAVVGGEPIVTYGKVLVSKSALVATTVNLAPEVFLKLGDAPVTILYGDEDYSYSWRGQVAECVKPDRIVVHTVGEPRVGERREFIRADMEMAVRVEEAPASVAAPEDRLEWITGKPADPSVFDFSTVTMDLSGSGARFPYALNVKKGSYACVSLSLPEGREPALIHLASRIVRCRPQPGEGAIAELAVEFEDVSIEQRELLNFLVFEARAKQLGMAGMGFLADDKQD